jgi:hypothetical protein
MHKNQLRNINPNYLHGCYPLDFRSCFGESPLYITVKNPKDTFPPISHRLLLLVRILRDISQSDLPAKGYFSEYITN